ncbi:hypothetical protein BHM03_00027943 [Ensete ventricosum]|uniref:Uncharacterized protein n=1 Tax=Ensete ventricosum TaxID=4639 RepID=A0A445MHT9_ENSVE|nr:hypothetical protein BHM03_00027943 [Ensete ventricosum]
MAAARGHGCRLWARRPLARVLPEGSGRPPAGAAAPSRGDNRVQAEATMAVAVVGRGQKGLRVSFDKRMILPLEI